MKNKIFIVLITVGLSLAFLTSCNNSDKTNKTTEKELELQKRELDLKQKELELKEKELAQQDKSPISNQSKPTPETKPVTTSPPTTGYNYAGHSNFNTFWNDFKNAISNNDKAALIEMTRFPFTDFYQLPYGRSGLTCNTSSAFSNKFNIIFPSCARNPILKGKAEAIDSEMLTSEEINAGVKFCFFLGGNCGNAEPIIAGYVFGKDKGLYKLVGLKYME